MASRGNPGREGNRFPFQPDKRLKAIYDIMRFLRWKKNKSVLSSRGKQECLERVQYLTSGAFRRARGHCLQCEAQSQRQWHAKTSSRQIEDTQRKKYLYRIRSGGEWRLHRNSHDEMRKRGVLRCE